MPSLWEIGATLFVLQLGFVVYGALYRLFLSPLSKIPGPRLAALTFWYEFYYDVILGGSPIIRVTPREVHVSDIGFLDEIYATGRRKRDKDPAILGGLNVPLSMGFTIDHDLHRKRREPLGPFFSVKTIRSIEPLIASKVQQMCEILESMKWKELPVSLSDIYFGFARDIMEFYSIGESQNVLGDLDRAATLRHNLHGLLLGVHVNRIFPWISRSMDSLLVSISKHIVPAGVLDLNDFIARTREIIQRTVDESPTPNEKPKHSIIHALRDNPNLPLVEKSLERLQDETQVFLMADVESPFHTLVILHSYLLANPNTLEALRAELGPLPRPFTLSTLEPLPYLTACISEANRLSFGVSSRFPRIAPDERLVYTDPATSHSYKIPPGTPLSTTSLTIHTDPGVFPDPWTFNPARWLGSGPEAERCRRHQFAFGRGSRKFIGMHLANAELCLAIANLVGFEMRLFETGIENVEFAGDFQVAMPKKGSLDVRTLVTGKVW